MNDNNLLLVDDDKDTCLNMSDILTDFGFEAKTMRVQLLLLITVAVLSAGVVVAQEASDEASAIKKIELLGGKVERDDTLPKRPVIGISFQESKRLTDSHLHLLKEFTRLQSLNFWGTQITDRGLKQLGELKNL